MYPLFTGRRCIAKRTVSDASLIVGMTDRRSSNTRNVWGSRFRDGERTESDISRDVRDVHEEKNVDVFQKGSAVAAHVEEFVRLDDTS